MGSFLPAPQYKSVCCHLIMAGFTLPSALLNRNPRMWAENDAYLDATVTLRKESRSLQPAGAKFILSLMKRGFMGLLSAMPWADSRLLCSSGEFQTWGKRGSFVCRDTHTRARTHSFPNKFQWCWYRKWLPAALALWMCLYLSASQFIWMCWRLFTPSSVTAYCSRSSKAPSAWWSI